ncbi:hypothetical protein CSA37_01690 [Candidatus Fermentibacteria bacterium]|nr:MAG: hypothetical protein CSA37_01690 [Candidatus Fermentibacteria bacterium]
MDRNEMEELLFKALKLDTHPVAVRLSENGTDLAEQPLSLKLNNCQLISIARHQGKYSSGAPERMVCAIGAACTGLVKTPSGFIDGTAAVGKYTADSEAGREFFRNTFKLGDSGARYRAIEFAPLGSAPFNADVVIVYGNPAQIMRLVHANSWRDGCATRGDTVAEAAVCSSMAIAMNTGEAIIGLPCAGDRRFGGTQNHEMLFAAPFEVFREKIVPSLAEMLEAAGSLYPVAPWVMYQGEMSDEYTL